MGKSRLISEFGARAHAGGATVLVGECLPVGDGDLPYAPIIGILRALIRGRGESEIEALLGSARSDLARLLPDIAADDDQALDGVPAEGSQARLFEQLLTVLARAARAAPLAVVVEDIHWADRSTRDFLPFLVRAARREPIVLIASYRTEELGHHDALRPFVHELERSGQAIRIELAPFTRTELREQVAAIHGDAPERSLVDRLFERSEGNPFFTEELLASSSVGEGTLPESLRDALLMRVAGQPPPVQRVLRIAAAAGRTVDDRLLSEVAGLGDEELSVGLRGAVVSYLLVHDPVSAGYSFRHALVREAIYADLLPMERRMLHLQLAQAFSERPALAGPKASAVAELAYHAHAAGQLPEAVVASVRAGMAAEEVHALSEALLHYERALGIWDTAGDPANVPLERAEVLRRAAQAANLTGAMERAIELARTVLERIDEHREPVDAALIHERLGRYLWTAGREGALPEYRRAVELVPVDPPSHERAFVLAAEAQVLMLCGRSVESAAHCEEALEIAREIDAQAVQAHLLNTMCGNLTSTGDFSGAVAAAGQARSIARRLGSVEEIARSYINGSEALDAGGHVEESIALAREGIDVARELGMDHHQGDFLRAEVAGRLLRSSRWEEADALLRDLIEREPTGVAGETAYTYLGYLRAERGELEAASRALDGAAAAVGRPERSEGIGTLTEVSATIELWAGRPEAAAAALAECLDVVGEAEWLFSTARLYELSARAHADVAARAPADDRLRSREAAAVEALRERLDARIAAVTGTTPPLVLASRATLTAERSRIDALPDAEAWDEAARLWEALGNRYLAAYARWRKAEAHLARSGDRRSIESLMREASAAAQALGARPLLEELQALARRARIELHRGDVPETVNVALQRLDLTPREIQVLALLADGLTNREIAGRLFISDKTASVHVSHILSKLSVPNRAAAAATAHRLGVARATE
jgi:DNA-binding CsgD family transcriptional regulator/tetratricopeptide (TPR) repeat protein